MIVDAILAKIFGTKNEREVKRMQPIVSAMSDLEPQMRGYPLFDRLLAAARSSSQTRLPSLGRTSFAGY